jgi:cyclopropane-fatty-acyl-phospholipid synthase
MRPHAWYEPALERGWLPDRLVRAGIRRNLRARLLQEGRLRRSEAFIAGLAHGPIALETHAANTQHYEVPAGFFEQVLGPRMKYSACLWPPGTTTLADAEDAMLALTAARADIRPGQRVLDLGCGWGAFALYVAERFPSCAVTALSNSSSQRHFITARAAERGLNNLAVITADINTFTPAMLAPARGSAPAFDRVVSIEMFEHLRNYPRLLERISGWLAADGRLFVHIFAHRCFAYPYDTVDASDWMAEHFFTGGTMPSEDLLPRFGDHLALDAQWRVNGEHYARTCEAWLANMDRRHREVGTVLADTYGPAEVARWRARWRTFFLACSELFRYRRGDEWFVAHYRFRHRGDAS